MAHLLLDSAGAHVSTPDTAALSVTGDIDIRARVAPTAWSGGEALQTVIAKDTASGSNRSYVFYIFNTGALRLTHFANGSTPITNVSTSATGFTNGTTHWIRVTLDVDNGAGGYDVKFWTADGALTNPDAADFSQLGSTITGGSTTSIFDSTLDVTMGTLANGTSNQFTGTMDRGQIYDGIDGTLAFDGDPSDPTTWDCPDKLFFTEKANGATVTLQGDAELVGACPSSGNRIGGTGAIRRSPVGR